MGMECLSRTPNDGCPSCIECSTVGLSEDDIGAVDRGESWESSWPAIGR